MSPFVTDGSETVGDDRGASATEAPYGITFFGNGRERLESPGVARLSSRVAMCARRGGSEALRFAASLNVQDDRLDPAKDKV